MRHLKTLRRIRGQNAAGLRRRLRKEQAKVRELEMENRVLQNTIHRLKHVPPQKLPIPQDFSDRIIHGMAERLARGMAEKVASEEPELAKAAHAASRVMAEFLSGRLQMNIDYRGEILYTVEQYLSDRDVRFQLSIDRVDVNFVEDLGTIRAARTWTRPEDDVIQMPKQMHLTNRDMQKYNR